MAGVLSVLGEAVHPGGEQILPVKLNVSPTVDNGR